MSVVDGATTEPRIRINRPDDENARCRVSSVRDQPKDFSQFTQPPTIRPSMKELEDLTTTSSKVSMSYFAFLHIRKRRQRPLIDLLLADPAPAGSDHRFRSQKNAPDCAARFCPANPHPAPPRAPTTTSGGLLGCIHAPVHEQWQGMSVNRPQIVGKYTNDIVYERLAPGILEELQERNPKDTRGERPVKHHQWLTEDIGHPALERYKILNCLSVINYGMVRFGLKEF
jgi:hypothetical protein